MSLQSLALLAQTDSTNTNVWLMFGLFLAAIAVPVVIGNMIAKSMRMTDYGWKIGLILASGCVAALIVARGFPPKLGIDLKGGEILIYEVDEAATVAATQDATASIDMNNLVATIANRLNPSGTKELVVRKYGDRQIEIIVPDATDLEIKQIKANIVAAGNLQFRIVANLSDHATLIAKARVQAGDEKRRQPLVRSDDGKTVLGRWVRVGVDSESKADPKPHKVDVFGATIRNSRTGELITIDSSQANTEDEPTKFEKWLKEKKSPEIDVLMYANDGYNVQGSHIQSVRVSIDEAARPCVNFTMKPEGANLFGRLTLANRPVENRRRRLGIIMDGALLSAPAIQSVIDNEGQITGRFTEAEVKFLVDILNAGSLPAILQSTPISENQIGSLLGQETIDSGTLAISISLLSVLIFIIIYYRFSGVVACAALLFNLLLILALMILVNATLTLPGLAGLVLTIGMSVDANVLVFERIREEVNKGAALRMAIRNGFSRATTTIVDANLTTLITALVLYGIGTDQIKGFAVTLVLGILMSMFTAIFCSRVIFDIAERRRWITKLTMMQILGATSIDFIGKRKVAAIVSGFLIIVGLCAVGARQKQIFDIDFLGGTSVVMELDTQNGKQLSDAEVREILQETLGEMTTNDTRVQYTLNRVNVTGTDNSVWKIDSSLPEVEDLQRVLEDNFQLVSYSMKFNGVTGVKDDDDKAGDDESGDDKAGDDKQSAFLKYGYFVSTNAQETPANQTPTTETPAEGTAGGDAGQSSFERSETTVEFTDYKIDEP
ncbi:MAG: protein translocase subunit SecD, partial [Pirellulaceae bacterium]|nr:protein translocase subunit SecD [Pirellulaceae bacterium]